MGPEKTEESRQTADLVADMGRLSLRERGLSSAHFLKLVEEQGNLGFWTADLTNERVSASLGLHTLLGFPLNAALTLDSLVRLMHPDDLAAFGLWAATLRAGQPIDVEYRVVRSDGIVRWVRNKAEVVLDRNGKPLRVAGVISDVTARQEARHMAQVGQERYFALLRAISVVVWTATADGATRIGSDWTQLTGQTGEQMVGYGWLNAIHPDDRARTREAWRTAVLHQGIYDTDYRLLCADGIYRWFNARGAPILNQDGSIREWVGVCLSITGSKRFQSEEPRPVHVPAQADNRLTAGQVRAARALLSWTVEKLATASGTSISTVARIEDDKTNGNVRVVKAIAIQKAFEGSGIVFSWSPRVGVALKP